jgi:hypothetical protein
MPLASHSGSCEHGCNDPCSRQKFKLGHSAFPFDMKSQYGVWLFYANGEAIRPIKGTYPRVVSRSRAYSVIGSYPRIISPGQSLSELVDGRPARAVAPDIFAVGT